MQTFQTLNQSEQMTVPPWTQFCQKMKFFLPTVAKYLLIRNCLIGGVENTLGEIAIRNLQMQWTCTHIVLFYCYWL